MVRSRKVMMKVDSKSIGAAGLFALVNVTVAGAGILPGPPIANGLELWLTARGGTGTTVDGASVTSWTSQVGGHVFSNIAGNAQPTYVSDSGGGIPAIDFSRSSGFRGGFGSSSDFLRGSTVFVIARLDDLNNPSPPTSFFYGVRPVAPGSVSTPNLARRSHPNDPSRPHGLFHDARSGGAGATSELFGDNIEQATDGTFNYYSALFDVPTPPIRARASINGVESVLAPPQLPSQHGLYFGNRADVFVGTDDQGRNGLDGQIRELLIYDRILSDSEVAQVESYLAGQSIVPEPTTLGLLGLTGLAMLRRRRI